MNNRIIIFLSLVAYALFAGISGLAEKPEKRFHTEEELLYFRGGGTELPEGTTGFFPGSGLCVSCHGFDTLGIASVNLAGEDVNVIDDWRSSMMANSAKDPFWRAKVSHEVLVNPDLQEEIETTCTKCHAPMGHYASIIEGATHYSIEQMLGDAVALDGVSCAVCHMMTEENLGNQFSGDINFNFSFQMYGPYESPLASPMLSEVGFQPVYSEHINDAGICASCHTLVTETVDLSGNLTGDTFVEQATYHEWLNSSYNVDNVSCQSCHMPRIEDPVRISTNSEVLPPRTPFGLHELAGANVFMLELMRDNRGVLGLKATEEQFDSTIALTRRMLTEKSLELELDLDSIGTGMDSVYFSLGIRNKAGHKFPSGYPSRRAFVEFLLTSDSGDTLFASGTLDENYEVKGHDAVFEPHYNIIHDPEQVQIYEMVLSDVEGNFTTVLLRADDYLKDNRLPPLGFSSSHSAYDTTRIAGNATTDPDFNLQGSFEGTGRDILHYHIALNGYSGNINASAKVYYQSLPPKWMSEIFASSTAEIDLFRDMYYDNDQSPVLVGAEQIEDIFIEAPNSVNPPNGGIAINVYPNPVEESPLNIELPVQSGFSTVEVWGVDGIQIQRIQINNRTSISLLLPSAKGIYLLLFKGESGTAVRKVIRL